MKANINEFFLDLIVIAMALVSRVFAEAGSGNIFMNDNENRASGTFLKIKSHAILTNKITSKKVQSAIDCAFVCFQTPRCLSYNLGKTKQRGTFICEPLNTTHMDTPLIAMPNYTHFRNNTTKKSFTNQGHTGRTGPIQKFVVQQAGYYFIEAAGARGGTLSCNYGSFPGTYLGGKGATMKGVFFLAAGTVLKIVVGHRGGDAVEVKGGQSTKQTAASLGLSVEDNAGTGGGGGSFVYTSTNKLLLAAGGGGGAAHHSPGIDGQITTAGSPCSKEGVFDSVNVGGKDGGPGHCNTAGASHHGGVGAGWNGKGCARLTSKHGETGGSRLNNWIGGSAGGMNSGNNGGPPPGAVGGFGGGGGGAEDSGASGGGGGYSGGGSGNKEMYAGGGGGSFCGGISCTGAVGGNTNDYGFVNIIHT
ncbi:loricrin-like [Actinia tenebrosa]|uniref:Loricrin-like n=1 Tax=Actinia tenebrosa TaxID=6105 RepID=A0A6P8IWF0_ACTTE|nr:loricrin-like [Actinia tenebrosa]